MSEFTKSLVKIALPVTLQCMLQSSFSLVDQLMIGQLGEESISAVGLGGNYALIFSVVLGAVVSVAGILIAQFLGAKDTEEAWRGLSLSALVGMLIAALFMAVSLTIPGTILGFYTKDSGIIREGVIYFRIVGFIFIPIALSMVISAWLRCREYAGIPLAASIGSVLINTGLNYCLIFGKCGFPKLGIAGAALATLVSQLLNFVIILIGFLWSLKKDGERIRFSFRLRKVTPAEYVLMLAPILVSEFLWSLGQNVEAAVYGHLGTESLAAYTLTGPVQGLMIGALSGLSAAAGVLIGKRLGSKEFDGAYEDSKKLLAAGAAGACLLSVLLCLLSSRYTALYNVEPSVRIIGRNLLIAFALYAPVKVSNMIIGGGILRSGGDTKTIMLIDIIGTWCFGIPLCLLAAYVLKWQILGVYALLTSEELIRLLASVIVFRKKNWMKSFS